MQLQRYSHRQAVIFGAGAYGRDLLRELISRRFRILAFCDNDVAKHGTSVEGFPVIAPDALAQQPTVPVIIAVKGAEEALRSQLNALGCDLLFGAELFMNIIRLNEAATSKDIAIEAFSTHLNFIRGTKIVRISVDHLIYGLDIVNSFDYYHSAVQPSMRHSFSVVDYSHPQYHDVVGFDLMPIHFPSFSEPVKTTEQYLEFARLNDGGVVLDLGAYSGLTSIIFKERVGSRGRVLAVDADQKNLESLWRNLSLYKRLRGHDIDVYQGAVWEHDKGITFSSEGNMGASALEIVGPGRGAVTRVESKTLSGLAECFSLNSVDFIKCDIEGAATVVFDDHEFFNRFSPRIIVEPHMVDGELSTERCRKALGRFGYACEPIVQHGVQLPLLQCSRN